MFSLSNTIDSAILYDLYEIMSFTYVLVAHLVRFQLRLAIFCVYIMLIPIYLCIDFSGALKIIPITCYYYWYIGINIGFTKMLCILGFNGAVVRQFPTVQRCVRCLPSQ